MEKKQIKKIVIVIAVILLPLIYSITYLEGFWDPYNNLDKIKVALVNEDKCSENCNSTKLIEKLKDSDTFNFIEKDKVKAEKLLLEKKYYATITIPEHFTSSFENAENANRKPATITYRTNKKTNYIASQLIENAVIRVEKELDNEVAGEVTKSLSNKLKDVPNQTEKISNAFGQIYNGTVTLNSGANKLKEGTNTLSTNSNIIMSALDKLTTGASTIESGTTTLKNGSNQLKEGSQKLEKGTATIKNQVKDANNKLKTQNSELQNGFQELTTGSASLKNGISTYNESSKQILDNIKNYFTNLKNTSTDETTIVMATTYINYIDALENNTTTLVTGSTNLDAGINNLITKLSPALNEMSTNMDKLENGLNELNIGASNLNNGLNSLSNGIDRLDTGTKTLFDGSNTLTKNYRQFNSGINTLNNSVSTLKEGTKTLENGTLEAKNKVEEATNKAKEETKKLDGLDEYTKKPVKLKDKSYGEVKDYGTFFSPFFMSLSLWLGGILIIVGLYYDPENRFKIIGKYTSNRKKRLIYYSLIGLAQSIVLPIVLVLCLNFTVTNWPLFFSSCILIGLSFLSIMLFMVYNFDDIGKFLAVVLLVIQLAACAGTFPLETEPSFFSAISPFMPMTYSVELLRESFVSIDHNLLIKNIVILGSIFIAFTTLIIITEYIKTKKEKVEVK